MHLNYGMSHGHGAPEARNSRNGEVKKKANPAIPSKMMKEAKGKPGNRNSRDGKVVSPDIFNGKGYKADTITSGKGAIAKVSGSGNPGSRNTRKSTVKTTAMFGS